MEGGHQQAAEKQGKVGTYNVYCAAFVALVSGVLKLPL